MSNNPGQTSLTMKPRQDRDQEKGGFSVPSANLVLAWVGLEERVKTLFDMMVLKGFSASRLERRGARKYMFGDKVCTEMKGLW